MKTGLLVILILHLFSQNNYGQEFDRCWPLGTTEIFAAHLQANLVFVGSSIRVDSVYRDIQFGGSCASISDSLGNMKFFSNGCVVGNVLNDTMINGDSLNPGPCVDSYCANTGNVLIQGNLILPYPNNSNQYVFFHETCDYTTNLSPTKLYTSVIDMTLDSGRGGVISKNVVLYQDTLCDISLTAVKHANGNDWWILVHEKYTSNYIRFLLTNSGISGPFFQSIGPVFSVDGYGSSKFSPDGNWYATGSRPGGIDLYQFDRCSGTLFNRTYLDFPDTIWNFVEFSPNSRFLYAVWLFSIYQLDLNSADITNSRQLVGTDDGVLALGQTTRYFYPQLGPDGKIYISCEANVYLHTIENPDSLGVGCNVIQRSLYIPSSNSMLPNFPNYRLGAVDSLYCDTINLVRSEHKQPEGISVYPNPANDFINISPKNENEKIETFLFYNQYGRLISSQIFSSQEVNLQSLSSGLYLLEVRTNKGNYFRKLVVNR